VTLLDIKQCYGTIIYNLIKGFAMKIVPTVEDKNYGVTSDGKIINFKSNKYLKLYCGANGYYTVSLGRKLKNLLVHRIVGNAFLYNEKSKFKGDNPIINHKDGNKLNNNVNNLEWCSYSHNNKHAYTYCGKKVPKSVIDRIVQSAKDRKGTKIQKARITTELEDKEIVSMYEQGMSVYDIEAKTNVNRQVVTKRVKEFSRIRKRNKEIIAVKNGNIVPFHSISNASMELNIPTSNIIKVLKKKRNHAGGYQFYYKD